MPERPYFTITREAFEKNAGYKSTVHALAELIDNSFEAEATHVVVVLKVDQNGRLQDIGVLDNGKGMSPELLQLAICEKAGSYTARQRGTGPESRRKLGKYGVGLPKASISQCNKLTVWSWTRKGFARNGIDIGDEEWIRRGAKVPESSPSAPPATWIKVAGLQEAKSGTFVLWEELDGITWARARWGEHSGLVPNLAFVVGRVYRTMIASGDLQLRTIIVDPRFRVLENLPIEANDPLYLTKGLNVPRLKTSGGAWPPDDPLFDDVTPSNLREMQVQLPRGSEQRIVTVRWRAAAARRATFAKYNGRDAGSLPHGKHAGRNVGLSIMREGREINLSQALSNPSEPRERWIGVELDLPHELDALLGMTNNKQEYTRLEQVLKDPQEAYIEEGETTQKCLERIEREDNSLAVCLRIAWRTQELWAKTKRNHLAMREEVVGGKHKGEEDRASHSETPEDEAEDTASRVDPSKQPRGKKEGEEYRSSIREELLQHGVPKEEAEQIAARVIERGLSYAIAQRSGLGSPFFGVYDVKGVRLLQLNTDHPMHEFLRMTLEGSDKLEPAEAAQRLRDAKLAILLLLEGWGKIESEAIDSERRRLIRHREDWGRVVAQFVETLRRERERG